MADPENISSASRQCLQCGTALPCHVPSDLCPKCLLKAAMGTQPATGPGGTVVLSKPEDSSRGLPQPGEQLGHYAILRLLGKGGMGAVYEAEDTESGRRVALKVSSHTLDSPEARARFFREGRLAASINHPNSLYIFGTEEIGGTPVIAMELARGGTLHDRVRAQGSLPIGEAVDCLLQIIAGLEAAQRVGILHRDIKPSNCFRDADGTVKIGDFGISISTGVRADPALTAAGAFFGTPAFCSPEQLRGEELNARADIYSVGATLFYLLTGHTPFKGKNEVQLLATVLEQRAPSPGKFRSHIPQGLAKAVLRCLEKQPGERFQNYGELRQALAPYSSAAPTPATLGLRFLAGALDLLVLQAGWLLLLSLGSGNPMDFLNLASQGSPKALALILLAFGGSVLYYALLEGRWSAAVGKAFCRLRVVRLDNNPPGFGRALVRAALYLLLPALPFFWIVYGGSPKPRLDDLTMTRELMGYCVLALLFCTVRRRNGFAAVQDLLTKTRVISRVALAARPVLPVSEMPPSAVETAPKVGPYHVLETLEASARGAWLLGYDLRLLRKVWIRTEPPGTPAFPAPLRTIGRVGRLRWLTGRRAPEANWDAFETLTGKPLASLATAPQPWSQVRYWVYDLAKELSAAEKDGTLPPVLALDRVWITGDGRAKLLDFPAPGLASGSPPQAGATPAAPPLAGTGRTRCFLDEVAAAALEGRVDAGAKAAGEVVVPLPLHARAFLNNLPQLADAEAVAGALQPLLRRVTAVSRLRRAAVVAGCLALPALACFAALFVMTMVRQWERSHPGVAQLTGLLEQRASVRLFGKQADASTDRQVAIYIASHYRALITNDATWSGPLTQAFIDGEARRFAEQSVAEHPAPTEKEIAEAEAALKGQAPRREMMDLPKPPRVLLLVFGATLVIFVCLPALLAALLCRGGLVLRLAGLAFVRSDGGRASRRRVFGRGLLAWSPLLVALGLFPILQPWLGLSGAALAGYLWVGGLTVISVAWPNRGLQDRLAEIWLVPR
jgi:uncharacterized RDD family membrane protein YckC